MDLFKHRDILAAAVVLGISVGYMIVQGGVPAEPEPTVREIWLLPSMLATFVCAPYILGRMGTKDMPMP